MHYIVISILGSILLFLFITPIYLHLKHGKNQRIALIIKGLGTFIPVLYCLAGTIKLNSYTYDKISSAASFAVASYWLLAGLVLCLIGDIIIGIHFVNGMLAFLLGHICYITTYLKIAPFRQWSIGIFIILVFCVLSYFYPLLKKFNNSMYSYILYCMVILAMVSIAVLLPFSIGPIGMLPAVGAVLFVLSDFLLARNMLVKVTRLSDAVSLYFYYLAQFILAMSVYLYSQF